MVEDAAAVEKALTSWNDCTKKRSKNQSGKSKRKSGPCIEDDISMYDYSFIKHAIPLYYSNNLLFVESQFEAVVESKEEGELLEISSEEDEEEQKEKKSIDEDEKEEEEEEYDDNNNDYRNNKNKEHNNKTLTTAHDCVDVARAYLQTLEFIARFYLLPGIPSYSYSYTFHFPPSLSHLGMTSNVFADVFPKEAKKLEESLGGVGKKKIPSKEYHIEYLYPLQDFSLSIPVQPIAQFTAINAYSAVQKRFGVSEDAADNLIRVTRPQYLTRFHPMHCYSPCVFFENASVGARDDIINIMRRQFLSEAQDMSKERRINVEQALEIVLNSKNVDTVVQALVPPPLGLLPSIATNIMYSKNNNGPGGANNNGNPLKMEKMLSTTSLPYYYHIFPPPISYKNTLYFLNWYINNFEYNIFDFYMSLYLPEIVVVSPENIKEFPELTHVLTDSTILKMTPNLEDICLNGDKETEKERSQALSYGTASVLLQLPNIMDKRNLPPLTDESRENVIKALNIGVLLKNSAYGDSENITIANAEILEAIGRGQIIVQGVDGQNNGIIKFGMDSFARILPIRFRRLAQRTSNDLDMLKSSVKFVDPFSSYNKRYNMKNTALETDSYVPHLKYIETSSFYADLAEPGKFDVIGPKTKFTTVSILRNVITIKPAKTLAQKIAELSTSSTSSNGQSDTKKDVHNNRAILDRSASNTKHEPLESLCPDIANIIASSSGQGMSTAHQEDIQDNSQSNHEKLDRNKFITDPKKKVFGSTSKSIENLRELLKRVPLFLIDLANHPMILLGLYDSNTDIFVNRKGIVSNDKMFVTGLSFMAKHTANMNCLNYSNIYAVCIRAYNDGSREDFGSGKMEYKDVDEEIFGYRRSSTLYTLPESSMYMETEMFRYGTLIHEGSVIKTSSILSTSMAAKQNFMKSLKRSELSVFPLSLLRGQYLRAACSSVEEVIGKSRENKHQELYKVDKMVNDLPGRTEIKIEEMIHPLFRSIDISPFVLMFGGKDKSERQKNKERVKNVIKEAFENILLNSFVYHVPTKTMRLVTSVKITDKVINDCAKRVIINNITDEGIVDNYISYNVIMKCALYGSFVNRSNNPLNLRYNLVYNTELMDGVSLTLRYISMIQDYVNKKNDKKIILSSNPLLSQTKVMDGEVLSKILDHLFHLLKINRRFTNYMNIYCINSVLSSETVESKKKDLSMSKAAKILNYMFGLGPYKGTTDKSTIISSYEKYSRDEVVKISKNFNNISKEFGKRSVQSTQACITKYDTSVVIPDDFFFTDIVLRHIITAIEVNLVKTTTNEEKICFGLEFIFKSGKNYLLCNNFIYSDSKPPIDDISNGKRGSDNSGTSSMYGKNSRYYYLTQAGLDAVAKYFCLVPHIFIMIKRLVEGINWRNANKFVSRSSPSKQDSDHADEDNGKDDNKNTDITSPSTNTEYPSTSISVTPDNKRLGDGNVSKIDGNNNLSKEKQEKEQPFPDFYDDKIKCVSSMRGIDSLLSLGESEFIRYMKIVDKELYGDREVKLVEVDKDDKENKILNLPLPLTSLLKASRRNDIFVNNLYRAINNFTLEQKRRRYVCERTHYVPPNVTHVVSELAHMLKFSGVSAGTNGHTSTSLAQKQDLVIKDSMKNVIGYLPGFIYVNNPNVIISGVNDFIFGNNNNNNNNNNKKFPIQSIKSSSIYRNLVPREIKPYSIVLSLKQPTLGYYGLVVETETRKEDSYKSSELWRNDIGSRWKGITVLWFGGNNLSTANGLTRRECVTCVSDSEILYIGTLQPFYLDTTKSGIRDAGPSLLENMLNIVKKELFDCCSRCIIGYDKMMFTSNDNTRKNRAQYYNIKSPSKNYKQESDGNEKK